VRRRELILAVLCACRGSASTPAAPPPTADAGSAAAPALPIPKPAFEGPPPADPVAALETTATLGCVVRASGHVDCWDRSGEVTRVPDLDDVVALHDSTYERCVVRRASGVTCLDTGNDPEPPVHIAVKDPIAVYSGYPSCAIRADHRVACWDREHAPKPRLAAKLRGVVGLAGNGYLTCALRVDGHLSCTDELDLAPTAWREVADLSRMHAFAIGDGGADNDDFYTNGCAVLDGGDVQCFALAGHAGKAIRAGTGDYPPPAALAALHGATALAMDPDVHGLVALVGGHVVVVDADGAARTLPDLADATAITFDCAVRAQGSVVCWGGRANGQPYLASSAKPVPVVGVAGVTSIAVGKHETWAVTRDGRAVHWGGFATGWAVSMTDSHDLASVQIGPSTIDEPCFVRKTGGVTCLSYRTHQPTDMGVAHVVELVAGDDYLARQVDGALRYWMNIEIGEPDFAMTELPAIPGAVEIEGHLAMLCTRDDFGRVQCGDSGCAWDKPGHWKCGAPKLARIAIDPARELAVNHYTACARLASGEVWCWGHNEFGELGRGSADKNVSPPGPVTGLAHATGLRATDPGFCASLADGSLTCWGTRELAKQRTQMLPPGSLDGPWFGGADGCTIRRDGLAACWGDNKGGRLGDGSIVKLDSPAAVPGL
jgi:hypothetical protein